MTLTARGRKASRVPAPAPPTPRRMRRTQPYLLLSPAILVLAALFLFPAIYNILTSFQEISPYSVAGDAEWVGLEKYVEVLTDQLTWDAGANTLFFLTAATVIIRIVLGVAIAVLLNADVLRRWKLRGIARTLVLVPWMIPPTVAVAAWRWLLDPQSGFVNQSLLGLGLIDAPIAFLADTATVWYAIITIVVWRELPFVVIVVTAGLQSIPREQYEAAAVDGANGWRRFGYITLPNLRPVIFVATMLTTIATFNNFVYVWLTTGGGPGTFTQVLATQLYSSAFVDNDLGRGAATGMLMMLVMIAFAAVYMSIAFRKRDV